MDIQLEKKNGLRPKHIVYIIIGIALLFVGWKLLFDNSGSTFRAQKERLTISTVSDGEFDDFISITGTVAPISTIYMDAYEGGRVSEKAHRRGRNGQKGGYHSQIGKHEFV